MEIIKGDLKTELKKAIVSLRNRLPELISEHRKTVAEPVHSQWLFVGFFDPTIFEGSSLLNAWNIEQTDYFYEIKSVVDEFEKVIVGWDTYDTLMCIDKFEEHFDYSGQFVRVEIRLSDRDKKVPEKFTRYRIESRFFN